MADVERLLVVGGGGREFTFIEEALRTGVKKVYSTRSVDAVNIGIEGVINTGIGEDPQAIGSWAGLEEMDLVVVGPEKPLVNGIGDILRGKGVPVFGPGSDGAIFEEDKGATHDFVDKYMPERNPDNSEVFDPEHSEEAKEHVRKLGPENVFTKRVGLEGGKGATGYTEDQLSDALAEIDAVAKKGEKILIQGRLSGPEYSALFILDGRGHAVATALSRDHKTLLDGGLGPMTGGMGAFAPLSLDQASHLRRNSIDLLGQQIVRGLKKEGINYRGTIYAGLMAENQDPNSNLYILEFNVRFGDPETQVLLQTLGGRAIDYMYAAARGSGENDMHRLYLDPAKAMVSLTVCLASPGYAAGDVVTGLPIHLPKELPSDVTVQFAGAEMRNGIPTSNGGRVLYVTVNSAPSLEDARKTAYGIIGRENDGVYIGDDEQVIRTDIGLA
jgi:phosphoribosylamine--glycine ligase